MELLVIAAIVGLVVHHLDRNRDRQHPHRLAGSTDVVDRDAERLSCELSVRHP